MNNINETEMVIIRLNEQIKWLKEQLNFRDAQLRKYQNLNEPIEIVNLRLKTFGKFIAAWNNHADEFQKGLYRDKSPDARNALRLECYKKISNLFSEWDIAAYAIADMIGWDMENNRPINHEKALQEQIRM